MVEKHKSSMEDIWNEVCKSFGSDGLFGADGSFISDAKPETTGSPSLDEAIGIWGYPRGRITQLAGQESSGKTLMSLMAIREWQHKSPNNWAVFIDAEYTFQPSWARSLGVDLSRLKIVKKNAGAEIFTFLNGAPPKEIGKSKTKPGILDQVIAAGGADKSGMGIIVLDSMAAIQPPQEITSEAGKQNVAPEARFLPPELRKLTPLVTASDVVFIAINQVRLNIGQMYGDPYSTPGGKAWKHHLALMINFAGIMNKDSAILDANGIKIGHRIRARIDKNKVAPPYRVVEFDIKYLEGLVNRHEEICDLAITYEIIGRPNQTTYVFKGETLARGRDNLYDKVGNDPRLQEELLSMVKEAKASGAKPDSPTEIPPQDQDDENKEE
jgi:recombination protein RecA